MISYKFARRSFLRGLGAGSAAVMVPLLRSIEARAAGAAAPLRFLIIHHPLGTASGLGNWRPNASATTTNFTLRWRARPFTPLQKYMVMVDGVNCVTATTGKDTTGNHGGQNTHEGGMVALMTGVPTLGSVGQQDHCAGGPSIDQIFLQKSPTLGGPNFGSPTPFQSLQLAADVRSDRDEKAPRVLSYLAPKSGVSDPDQARQPLFPDTSPLNVYNRIFGGALPSGMNGAQVLAQKESVITYLQGRSRAHADARAGQRKGPADRPRRGHQRAREEPSGDVRHAVDAERGLREADGAGELLEHQHAASRDRARSTATWAASTTTFRIIPPATRTSISGRPSCG